MLKNYIKVALRNIARQKVYSLINLLGLALGMALCLLILLFIQDELSYDRFHENADRIFRLAEKEEQSGRTNRVANIFPIMGPHLVEEFPEVLQAVRFEKRYRPLVRFEDKSFIEERFFYADPSVFDVFTFPLKNGDPNTALDKPYTLLVTEETAMRYFGEENPVGKVLFLDSAHGYTITGILKNVPRHSHIKFDFLASISTLEREDPRYGNIWGAMSAYTYFLLPEGYSSVELEQKIPDFIRRNRNERAARSWNFFLQPLKKIHLHSNLSYELEANGDIRTLYIFSAIALFILIIACINFMNLSTARSASRALEVGVRKVLGAERPSLAKQFLGESLVMTIAAVPFSVALAELFARAFNAFAGKALDLDYFGNPLIPLGLLALILFVGLVSGSYPAVFLSRPHPSAVLRGRTRQGVSGIFFRRILVIIQFSVSVFLIIGTMVIRAQLHYIQSEKLGFQKENIVVLPIRDQSVQDRFELLKSDLLQNAGVTDVTSSTSLPGVVPGIDFLLPEGKGEEEAFIVRSLLCDHDFVRTFGMEFTEGRDFDLNIASDKREGRIINETAAGKLGWETAVGRMVLSDSGKGRIIGVVKDFHFRSKHQSIEPLVISLLPDSRYVRYMSVRIKGEDIRQTLDGIRERWHAYSSGRPFEYFFLDDRFDSLYRSEERLSRMFEYFSFLAIFIACLGLFGLAAYATEQRTKEVGIRKVLGASAGSIIILLTRDFSRWVAAANLIAWPIAYYALTRWLQSFAYRIAPSLWIFAAAAGLSFLVALFTVSFQAAKAALANPIRSLRYE